MRVQLTLNQVSLCCYAAMNMIDRWVCRRKVRGALEVAVELWDGREVGWVEGGERRSHSRSHHAIHTNRLMHRHRHTNLQFSKFSAHMDAFAHITQINTRGRICCFFPRFLSAQAEFVQTHWNRHARARTHTHTPDRRLEEPSVSLVTEQLGRVIIICELWLTLTLSGWSAMMGWHAATSSRWLQRRMVGDGSLRGK